MTRMAECHPELKHYCKGKCKSCYARDPEILRKTYQYAKTPSGKAARAKWSASPAGRASAKRRRIERNYGITIEQYEEMKRIQNGLCAICLKKPPPGRIAVDHCHATGKIRGLLCIACNLILGNGKDSPDILRAAADYLERGAA